MFKTKTMVNVIVYLDKINDAQDLVDILLRDGLVANASIDIDNISYRIENNELIKNVNCVITAQTKSLLFSSIEKYIRQKFGDDVQIYSVPITQANNSFDTLIRSNTKKI